ncbi:MAG TPA: hypothetical protein VMU76_01690 [Acidimicrobiales bacterium]|nr:hypothetical protein [Acidimicrobiales bacterium]
MSETGSGGPPAGPEEEREYLARVMAEIDEEVRERRAAGDLPARVERELDELFLEHSPVAGRAGSLREALRMVDAATFIDPVVPIASSKSGGAVVKRGLRQLSLWYVGYVTHQVSQFATAVSRSLHLLGEEVRTVQRQLDSQRIPPAPVVEVDWAHRPDAWWVGAALKALANVEGRVLHSASGDGWLVRACEERGIDAYGVDPRPGAEERGADGLLDLRSEPLAGHLEATRAAALGGLVLTGTVEAMAPGEREHLLTLVVDRLAPGGTLVLHSLSPSAWGSEDLPVAADLAFGHPLRAATWAHELTRRGFDVHIDEGRGGARDYLVVATLHASPPPPR